MKKFKVPMDIMCHKVDYTGSPENNYKHKGLGNAHTHGLGDYGKTDLCLGIDLDLQETQFILNSVAELMCDPNRTFNMSHAHSICDNNDNEMFRFYIVPAFCCEEPSNLIVLADKNGTFPDRRGCDAPYCYQLNSHHEIEVLPTKDGRINVEGMNKKQKRIFDNIVGRYNQQKFFTRQVIKNE